MAETQSGRNGDRKIMTRLILASASRARHDILKNAGIVHEVVVSGVDEEAVRAALGLECGEVDGDDVADVLARAKAETVSAGAPDAWVIGADQVLTCDGRLYFKAQTLAGIQAQMFDLRGKTHRLHSAVVLARDGAVGWARVIPADITMRQFTAAELGRYLGRFGERALESVGGYELDGAGVRLIDSVAGDYFTVLGLPLLHLLPELRDRGLLDYD